MRAPAKMCFVRLTWIQVVICWDWERTILLACMICTVDLGRVWDSIIILDRSLASTVLVVVQRNQR